MTEVEDGSFEVEGDFPLQPVDFDLHVAWGERSFPREPFCPNGSEARFGRGTSASWPSIDLNG